MSQQDLFHYQMVSNYHQMMIKCKTYEKQLESIYTENSRFQTVAQNLAIKIEELSGCKVEKCVSNSENEKCCADSNMSLEVSRICSIYSRDVGLGKLL